MNPLFLILGLGALALVSSKKSSSSSKKEKEEVPDYGDVLQVPDNNIPDYGGIIQVPGKQTGVKGKTGLKDTKCKITQYLDNNTCVDFWIPGPTDDAVKNEIDLQLAAISYSEKDKFNIFCEDVQINDQQFKINEKKLQILRNVINKLWPNIPKDMLPPVVSSPDWLHEIWRRCKNIYDYRVCGIDINKQ